MFGQKFDVWLEAASLPERSRDPIRDQHIEFNMINFPLRKPLLDIGIQSRPNTVSTHCRIDGYVVNHTVSTLYDERRMQLAECHAVACHQCRISRNHHNCIVIVQLRGEEGHEVRFAVVRPPESRIQRCRLICRHRP